MLIRFTPASTFNQSRFERYTKMSQGLTGLGVTRVSPEDNSITVAGDAESLASLYLRMDPPERVTASARPNTSSLYAEVPTWLISKTRAEIVTFFTTPTPAAEKSASKPAPEKELPDELAEAAKILKTAGLEAFHKVTPLLLREGRELFEQIKGLKL